MVILNELEKLRLKHVTCEDGWYSCPKSTDGCHNPGEGDECNCGADRHNATLDNIIGHIANTNKEWNPIETAPRDGTGVMLCKAIDATGRPMHEDVWPYYVQVAFWVEEEEKWIVDCNRIYDLELDFTPTHWMPLLANPLSTDPEIGQTRPKTTKGAPLEFTPYSGVDVGDIKGK